MTIGLYIFLVTLYLFNKRRSQIDECKWHGLSPDTKLPYVFHSDLDVFQTPKLQITEHTARSYDFSISWQKNLLKVYSFFFKNFK